MDTSASASASSRTRGLPGSYKVAVLIKALGIRSAQGLLQGMSNEERELIYGHLTAMDTVDPRLVREIAAEFAQRASGKKASPPPATAPGASSAAKPAKGAASPAGDAARDRKASNLTTLRSIDAEQMFQLIRDEHPQTIALVVAHLTSEVASDVLTRLPDELKVDVALRVATLDKVISTMVEEIETVFEDILKNKKASGVHRTGGVKQLAEILNLSDETTGELVLNEIEELDPELAARIKQGMFVFEDLVLVDNKGLQKMLRKVETGELAVALKGASDDVKQKIFQNMSERASEMLNEEIEAVGAVRMKDVEDAQQTITRIIQDMESKGELIISGRRGEEFIA